MPSESIAGFDADRTRASRNVGPLSGYNILAGIFFVLQREDVLAKFGFESGRAENNRRSYYYVTIFIEVVRLRKV
jgi:hypothetical protein